MLEETCPVPDHDGLRDFNAGRQKKQPSEEQHGDNRSRDGTRDRGDAKHKQSDAECQEPTPVVDHLGRELDFKALDISCGHEGSPWRMLAKPVSDEPDSSLEYRG